MGRNDILNDFIETFEDFLNDRCVTLENEEKDEAIADGQTPDSISNIYGTDYSDLSDMLEPLLIRYGILPPNDENGYPVVTEESVFTAKSGDTITIERYGPDDYSATWDDTFSVRGTFKQIAEELKEEL